MTSDWDPEYTPPAQSVGANTSQDALEQDRLQYCWITDDDYSNGFDPYTLVTACQNLYSTYCVFNSTAPSPSPLSRAPAACTPDRSGYNPPAHPDPVFTPTPVQSGMTQGCNKFYLVKKGDTCDAVAKSNNVTLADFYEWNPAVTDTCINLQLNVYVCVGYDVGLIPTVTPPPVARI